MTPVTLPISSQMIGDVYVNTVSARELHVSLGIRKDFSNWIKSQIDKLGLEKEIDYVIFAQKGENSFETRGRMLSEYTLTLDAAKHIAMASRTPQGKMVRTYLIEIEKRFWAERGVSDTPLDQIARGEEPTVPKGVYDLSPLYAIMEAQTRILEHISNQNTVMLSLMDRLSKYEENIHFGFSVILSRTGVILDKLDKRAASVLECSALQRATITDQQRSDLSVLVSERARCLSECYGIQPNVISTALYVGLKSRFGVMYYGAISASEYDEAVTFIENFNIGK